MRTLIVMLALAAVGCGSSATQGSTGMDRDSVVGKVESQPSPTGKPNPNLPVQNVPERKVGLSYK